MNELARIIATLIDLGYPEIAAEIAAKVVPLAEARARLDEIIRAELGAAMDEIGAEP